MGKKDKKEKVPDFSKCNSYIIYCVKDGLTSGRSLKDDTILYCYTISILPTLKELDEEYRILAKVLSRVDKRFLSGYFAPFKFKEISVESDSDYGSVDDLIAELQIYYNGEKWGIVSNFDAYSYDSGEKRYVSIDDLDVEYFWYLPKNPDVFTDALNFFNVLSFENTTHFIKLHIMWKKLCDIQKLAFAFKSKLPENYNKLFVPRGIAKINPDIKKRLGQIVDKINEFRWSYTVEKKDYPGIFSNLKKVSKEKIYSYKNAFEGHLGRILNVYIDELKQAEIIAVCVRCDNVFKFVKSRKYCSDWCRKSAENKRYYKKHKKRLRIFKREDMRDTREFMKKMKEKDLRNR